MHSTASEVRVRKGLPNDIDQLIIIWHRSVEATHKFLTAADIAMLEPEVQAGLRQREVWVAEVDGVLAGFMAMNDNMIEALFIDPTYMGRKLGTGFIDHARKLRGCDMELRVDVNEDNPGALAFYLARGFRQMGRSETDSSGRPWPLLHLVLWPGNSG